MENVIYERSEFMHRGKYTFEKSIIFNGIVTKKLLILKTIHYIRIIRVHISKHFIVSDFFFGMVKKKRKEKNRKMAKVQKNG